MTRHHRPAPGFCHLVRHLVSHVVRNVVRNVVSHLVRTLHDS